MSFFNLYNQTDKLNSVLLGNWVKPEYFDTIEDSYVRDPLKKISNEILEDLEIFEKILSEHGVKVFRTESPESQFSHETKNIAPSLAVRNNYHVIGNKLYQFNKTSYDDNILNLFSTYKNDIIDLSDIIEAEHRKSIDNAKHSKSTANGKYYGKEKYHVLAGSSWPKFEDLMQENIKNIDPEIIKEIDSFNDSLMYHEGLSCLEGPNVILVDNKIIFDYHEYANYMATLTPHFNLENFQPVHINTTAGHTDGCFVYLNNSTVVTIADIINHSSVVNGMNEIVIPWENYQTKLEDFCKIKSKNKGAWWIPGEEDNNKMTYFINKHLIDWTGNVEETVFDVNVLPLDGQNVFVSSNNKNFHDLLKDHNINPIYVPWRHGFFTDNGLHCITLCLHRG